MTLDDPYMTFDPSNALRSGHGFFPSNLVVIVKQIDPYVTRADPFMTFDSSNALRFGQGFFPPNLVAIGHFYAIWPLVDLGWPLHDLWPQQCITLWSGVLPTKFDGLRTLLSKLIPTWPQLTPTWPLTPIMHYALVRGSSTKFGGHRALLSNLTPTWPQLTPTWPLTPIMH